MYEISTHRVKEVRVFVYNVLIIEKELVWFQELLLLDHQLVGVLVVLHDLVIFHVVVRDSLPSEHYQSVLIYHVEAYKPYAAVNYRVQHNPRVPFDVQLLNRRSIPSCLVTDSVYVSMAESAAIRSPHCLLQAWKRFLVHSINLELFTLFQILSF